ncbi:MULTISPECIES: amidohydrolase family protein [unclassified Thiocapsa]|uniref:amidohydrolase family protein n=1 Tax=unclassified Thiocapsa TaxID=2641286 RepID=UPI0035AEC680
MAPAPRTAYHHFEEKTKGSLEPGKLADFAILSKDPTAVEPTTIADSKVTETIKEGVTVFRLTAEEERKAELMLHPGSDGRDVFASKSGITAGWETFLGAGTRTPRRWMRRTLAIRPFRSDGRR